MDIVSITGASLLMRGAQTQQALSTTMMKQAAEQQDKIASLLAQNVQQTAESRVQKGDFSTFSTYA